jgi:hypothetical protein
MYCKEMYFLLIIVILIPSYCSSDEKLLPSINSDDLNEVENSKDLKPSSSLSLNRVNDLLLDLAQSLPALPGLDGKLCIYFCHITYSIFS